MPNVNDSSRYLDLAAYISKLQSYADFEGMASGDGVVEMATKCAHLIAQNDEEEKVLRNLMCHYLYTRLDTAGDLPTEEEVIEIAAAIQIVIGCRWFLSPDVK